MSAGVSLCFFAFSSLPYLLVRHRPPTHSCVRSFFLLPPPPMYTVLPSLATAARTIVYCCCIRLPTARRRAHASALRRRPAALRNKWATATATASSAPTFDISRCGAK